MERKHDMGRHTKTLHIVVSLLDIPTIQQDMVNAVAYSAATETDCSNCKHKNRTIEMCKNKKFDRELKDKVANIVPSLVKNLKALQDLLQQKGDHVLKVITGYQSYLCREHTLPDMGGS